MANEFPLVLEMLDEKNNPLVDYIWLPEGWGICNVMEYSTTLFPRYKGKEKATRQDETFVQQQGLNKNQKMKKKVQQEWRQVQKDNVKSSNVSGYDKTGEFSGSG